MRGSDSLLLRRNLLFQFGDALTGPLGTGAIGTGAAWLITMCRFPGRGALEWALVLPFAVPAYVLAYVYTDMLDYAGPVQTALRGFFGWTRHDYWFPDIRSVAGAIAMLVLVLYPYVYLLARNAFLNQSGKLFRDFHRNRYFLQRKKRVSGVEPEALEKIVSYKL